ncbi:AmmeMemoRadiSam system protein B [candidate division KSB1 bacterium]|nr:AmmeMemoRadiSam system protein B [candidate division KSB1 bacterium]
MSRVCFVLFGLLLSISADAQPVSQTIRPIRDDIGFCWDAEQMHRLISHLQKTEKKPVMLPVPSAAISPHDDYLYAGAVYYPLFKSIRTREAVIIGLTHGSVRREIGDPQNILILDEYDRWQGLSKPIEPSPLRERIIDRLGENDFIISNSAHQLEHSIEALLPFLQYFNPDIHITPIMVTAMPLQRMQSLSAVLTGIIIEYMQENDMQLGRDLVILISSDANHYGADFNNTPFGEDARAHEKGTAEDRRLAQTYLTGPLTEDKIIALTKEIWGADYREPDKALWCGRYSIPFGLLLAHRVQMSIRAQPLKGHLLRYSDTYSEGVLPLKKTSMGLTAPFSLKHWVGFFSVAYY